ncbi:hypothetical protein [Carboxylicivirga marina]|uniref:Uncharacterized protein n=1 Tax=Carboxylicivirga marina TaxID=2800988 RepID=A0ABS1HJW7_9BACT|nr:hypothetical protein [Carboxylicivirga marina]MBK3517962.1 hypothetical protein [Carboxylicivirga marina]
MSEKMKHFVMAYGIEIPQEIDENPFIGLSREEVDKIKTQLKAENIFV